MGFIITQIAENDWNVLQKVRLRALQKDPAVFGSSYEENRCSPKRTGSEKLASLDNAIFVIYRDGEPVGMTAASIDRDDPERKTGILWGSWLNRKHAEQAFRN